MPTSSLRTHIRGKHLEPAKKFFVIFQFGNNTNILGFVFDFYLFVTVSKEEIERRRHCIITPCVRQTMPQVVWHIGQGAPSLCPCRPRLQTLEPGLDHNQCLSSIFYIPQSTIPEKQKAFQAKSSVSSDTLWP